MWIEISEKAAKRIEDFNRKNFNRWKTQDPHKGWKSEDYEEQDQTDEQ